MNLSETFTIQLMLTYLMNSNTQYIHYFIVTPIPDIGEATKNANEPAAKHSPRDFSMLLIPNKSTSITGYREAQQPEVNKPMRWKMISK